jgi:DNA polymerase III epsilon subunit-like protein
MLNEKYSYCFLDFETTWLSHERDDIIQVGLIITDHQLQIQEYFSSFINPGYEIEKLKTIVSYTTGITIDQIQSGVSIEDFKNQFINIISQSEKPLVFVGHNVNFDIKFLNKYFKDSDQSFGDLFVDTMERAKVFIHYPPSFSLDILYPLVREQMGAKYFQSLAHKVDLEDIQNHDALSDCLICLGIIEYCLTKIEAITTSFPIASKILGKADMWFLDKEHYHKTEASTEKVPLLDFPEKPQSTLIMDSDNDFSKFANGSKLYYGNLPLEQVIRKATGLGKVILCTNSTQKLNIIKSKAKLMGLHDISFIKEQQQVDKNKLNTVFSKEKLEVAEAWFFLKYCSHKLQGLGLLDLNTTMDYKIYNYIREDIKTSKSSLILATHGGLFSLLDSWEYADYTLLFLDYERRYTSYIKYKSTAWDPVNFARILDNYAYKFEHDKDNQKLEYIKELASKVDMFCSLFFMETSKTIEGMKQDGQGKYELGVIDGRIEFSKSLAVYHSILSLFEEKKGLLSPEDTLIIHNQIDKIKLYIENLAYARLNSYSEYIQYTYALSNTYVDYSEFMHLFKDRKYYFLSNWNTTFELIEEKLDPENTGKKSEIIEIDQVEELDKIKIQDTIFILNNNPTKAKKIFEHLQGTQLGKDHKILVENVTGGRGKNISMVKRSNEWILVGGYDLILQCIHERIYPKQLIVFEALGLLHQQIISDISYRMKQGVRS